MAGGALLIAAALGLGYLLFINVVVGLAEPVHLTALETAFVGAELLFALLLLATGLAALACTNRRRLLVLAAIAAIAAADLALACVLYPYAMAQWCAAYEPPPSGETDLSDCAGY
jgi:hypothetical protein